MAVSQIPIWRNFFGRLWLPKSERSHSMFSQFFFPTYQLKYNLAVHVNILKEEAS